MQPNLTFLSDQPAPLSVNWDPFGCLNTAATLYDILAEWYDGTREGPLILGLFGGYGQGKSTILETLRAPLHNKEWPDVSERRLETPVEVLAVESWHYQPDEVSGHFNQVMTRETWVQNSGTMRKVAFGTFLDFVSALNKPTGGGLKQGALERVGAEVPLYQAAGDVIGDVARKGWDVLNTDVGDLARSLLKLPENQRILFWIDDLDRSSVKVQLAFLKQVYAYRERLGVPVVVAMDPSDILKGTERSSNEDLLRKVFSATLLLPAKRPERFVFYAQELCRQQFPELDEGTVSQAANLISYVTSGNPRFVKRYLNSLAAAVHRIHRDAPGAVTPEKFLCLARWVLAQTRWPPLFGYHGEEELLCGLLRRVILGEPAEASLTAFVGTLEGNEDLTARCEEAVHFLRQTRGLAGIGELDVMSWLVDRESRTQGFDWFRFWDSVECRSPEDAIDFAKGHELPEDFLGHFRARLSRWVHRRCFNEAVAILDVFWRIIYEGDGPIGELEELTEAEKSETFGFLVRSLSHEEVAEAWRTRATWPTLNSLFRVAARLPEDWLGLYVETVSKLDGEFPAVERLLRELSSGNLSALEGERQRKAVNLLAEWLMKNWEDNREAIEFYWRADFYKGERAQPLCVGVDAPRTAEPE